MRVVAIIVAAGRGTRMQSQVNKHLLPLAGKPVIAHTLRVFEQCPQVDAIVPEGKEPRKAGMDLMGRAPKPEQG